MPISNELADLLRRYEGDYDSFNRGHSGDAINQRMNFANMTIAEIHDLQNLPRYDPRHINTVGKYQIGLDLMNEMINKHHFINPNLRFTPDIQDYIYSDYIMNIKRHQVKAYVTGQPGATLHSAQTAIANEWTSTEVPGTGLNRFKHHASISAAQVAHALDAMRDRYQQAIQQGIKPDDAWHMSTGLTPMPAPSLNREQTLAPQAPASSYAPASAPASSPSDPRNPASPHHAFYRNVRDQLVAIHDAQGIRLTDRQLENGTATLMADARANYIYNVTSMQFNTPGGRVDTNKVIMFDGDPQDLASPFSFTNMSQAFSTPAEQSLQRYAQLTQRNFAEDLAFEQQQQMERLMSRGRGGPSL